MIHGETVVQNREYEDADCKACQQTLGTNPYCSTCIKLMSPELIATRKQEIADRLKKRPRR